MKATALASINPISVFKADFLLFSLALSELLALPHSVLFFRLCIGTKFSPK